MYGIRDIPTDLDNIDDKFGCPGPKTVQILTPILGVLKWINVEESEVVFM